MTRALKNKSHTLLILIIYNDSTQQEELKRTETYLFDSNSEARATTRGFSFGKMKVKFVSQPFLTNGSGFIHQNGFLRNQNIYFPAKLCEIRKHVRE